MVEMTVVPFLHKFFTPFITLKALVESRPAGAEGNGRGWMRRGSSNEKKSKGAKKKERKKESREEKGRKEGGHPPPPRRRKRRGKRFI
jgi:hypothetical protein